MVKSRIFSGIDRQIEEPAINLTPLIDVVFVILIMFILIAPLLKMDEVELAESSHASITEAKSVTGNSPITMHVHQDNTIWFDNQPINPNQLTEKLKYYKTVYPKAVPQVFHDKRASFGTYQSIKNAAEEAGFNYLEIILKPV